jgi:hypothetical protein
MLDAPQGPFNLGSSLRGASDDAPPLPKAIELDLLSSAIAGLPGQRRRFAAAIACFTRFLEVEPNAPEAGQVKVMIEELKKQIKD